MPMWINTTWTKGGAGLLLALVGFVLFFRWFAYQQVYHPWATFQAEAGILKRPFEDVYFTASDGIRLNGWFFPAATNAPRSGWVVLLCHGNAGNISHRLELYQLLEQTGASLFAFDYRGYGRSAGHPDEPGTYLDAQAAYQWLRQRGYAAQRILLLGESLGGGVATELALRESVGGLILVSSFTSIPDAGAELFPWLPVRWLSPIHYDTKSKLPRLKTPLLILHSRQDALVRFHHAQANFAAAPEPKLLWELAGDHNESIEAGRDQYLAGLRQFFMLLDKERPGTK